MRLAWSLAWQSGSERIPIRTFFAAVLLMSSTFLLLIILRRRYFHPLSKFPGPFLASATNLHKCWRYLRGNEHEYYHRLHTQYGLSALSPAAASTYH